jgi:nitric oxide reductase NorD protein
LEARGGTSRRLLVVLSDGLAYDHGYERPTVPRTRAAR